MMARFQGFKLGIFLNFCKFKTQYRVLAFWVASSHEDEEKTNLVGGDGAWTLAVYGGSTDALQVLRLCEEDDHGFVMMVVVWRCMEASCGVF